MKRKHLLAVAAAVAVLRKEDKKKRRSIGVKEWLLKQKTYSHINLLTEFKLAPEIGLIT